MKTTFNVLIFLLSLTMAKAQCIINYNLTGVTSVCQGSTASLNLSGSQIGVSYQLYKWKNFPPGYTDLVGAPQAGTGAGLTWDVSGGDKYIVKAQKPNCTTITMNGQVTVTMLGVSPIYNVTSTGNNCPGSTSILLEHSQSTATYQLFRNGTAYSSEVTGVDGPISWPNVNASGSFQVWAKNTVNLCTLPMNGTVIINAAPASYTLAATNEICQGQPATITLSQSQAGVNYTLYGLSPGDIFPDSFASKEGTGESLSWTASPEKNMTFYISARNTTTGCSREMSNRPVTIVNPSSGMYAVSTDAICASNASVILSGSAPGVNYTLLLNGAPLSTREGMGSAITWTGLNSGGRYTVSANNPITGCGRLMIGYAELQSMPAAFTMSANTSVCQGVPITVSLSQSQTGVEYKLYGLRSGGIFPQSYPTIDGTGSVLNWSVSAESTTTFYIEAVNKTSGCSREMINRATTTVNPVSPVFTVSTASTCSLNASVSLDGSVSGVSYTLFLNGASFYTREGTGSAITWTGLNLGGRYTVTAYNPITGCYRAMNSYADLLTTPTGYSITSSESVCQGAPITVSLSNSQLGVSYLLKSEDKTFPFNSPDSYGSLEGTGGSLNWSVSAETTTTFYIDATSTGSGCKREMNNRKTTIVKPSSDIYVVSSTTSCSADAVLTLDRSNAGVVYNLFKDGNDTGLSQTGTGSQLSWSGFEEGGVFSVTALNAANGCSRLMMPEITLSTTPHLTITPEGPQFICEGSSITLTANTPDPNVEFTWSDGSTGPSIVVGTEGTFTVNATDVTTGCQQVASTSVGVYRKGSIVGTIRGQNVLCEGSSASLIAGTSSSLRNFRWSTGETTRSIVITKPGAYAVSYDYAFITYKACKMVTCNVVARMNMDDFDILQEEIETTDRIGLYPIPASNQLTIVNGNNLDVDRGFELFNSTGNVLLKDQLAVGESEKIVTVAFLANGVYFLRFSNSSLIHKVVIEK